MASWPAWWIAEPTVQQPGSLPAPQQLMRRIRERAGVGLLEPRPVAPLPGAVVAETVICA